MPARFRSRKRSSVRADRWPARWRRARGWACARSTSALSATTSGARSSGPACARRASTWITCSAAAEITPDQILCARLLHIDGHDTPAVAHAARIAHGAGIPVTVDVDTIYHGFDRVLPHVDYLIASSEFPAQWTNERDPLRALELIQREYGMRVAAMTLGAHGALALENGRFLYSPAFVVNCVDTTGAGDVFHGAFCYSVLQGMRLADALDFSNAMAAINCTAMGARGGICGLEEVRALMQQAPRRSHPDMQGRIGRAAPTS